MVVSRFSTQGEHVSNVQDNSKSRRTYTIITVFNAIEYNIALCVEEVVT